QVAGVAQIGSDLIAEHFLEAETKKVSRVTTVRAGYHVSSHASRTAWTPVAQGTAIGKTRADGNVGVDIADSVLFVGPLPLHVRKLALKKLASAPDGAIGITINDVDRR